MPQAARIPESDWERNKELVRALYLDQNMKLEQLVGCMRTLHGFSASKAQYVRRLDKWGFRKNYTKAEWEIAGSQVRRRKEKEGKETQLVMNGRPISAKKLKKQLGRYIWSWTFGPQPQFPSQSSTTVVVRTPSGIQGFMNSIIPWYRFHDRLEENSEPLLRIPQPEPILILAVLPSAISATEANDQIQRFLHLMRQTSLVHSDLFSSASQFVEHIEGMMPHSETRGWRSQTQSLASSHPIPLLQWAFYAGSNNLLGRKALDSILRWIIDSGNIRTFKQVICLGGPTVEAFSSSLLPSVAKLGSGELISFFLEHTGDWVEIETSQTDVPAGNLNIWPPKKLPDQDPIAGETADANQQICVNAPLASIDIIAHARILLASEADVNQHSKDFSHALQEAARRDDLDMVILLLDSGVNPNVTIHLEYGERVCSHRYSSGAFDSDILSRLVTPTQFAAYHGNKEMLQRLLESGAEVDTYIFSNINLASRVECLLATVFRSSSDGFSNSDLQGISPYLQLIGQSPLAICISACSIDHARKLEMVELLLQSGIDVNAPAGYWRGRTALQAAAEIGDWKLIHMLFCEKADVNAAPSPYGGLTVLQSASLTGDHVLVQWLLYLGGDVHQQPAYVGGLTCLQAAALSGNMDLVDLLLQRGGNIHAPATLKGGYTALQAAVHSRSMEMVRKVLEATSYADHPSGSASALYHAVYNEDDASFRLLIESGACPDPEGRQQAPLLAAIYRGAHDMAQDLINAGATPNVSTRFCDWVDVHSKELRDMEWTPLAAACYWGDMEMVLLLWHAGANINIHEWQWHQYSPLQAAVCRPRFEMGIVRFLLTHGASVHPRCDEPSVYGGQELVELAISRGRSFECVQLLIDHGANPTYTADDTLLIQWAIGNYVKSGEKGATSSVSGPRPRQERGSMTTGLSCSVGQGTLDTLDMLLGANAKVDGRTQWRGGMTGLQAASHDGYFPLVEYLVSRGADVNALPAEEGGATALQHAAMQGHFNIAVLLIMNGATINASPARRDGRTALQAAAERGRLDMVYLLLENDSDVDNLEDRCRDAARRYSGASFVFRLSED
ncbi:hypothetical protein FDECE_15283 [Fusarium decemcellulare]|nr:hypothetical protein FDECE_15283 [Fusarium decemcellulare]